MLRLHEEQGYVFEHAKQLGVEAKLIKHSKPTNTCAEKLRLLHDEKFSDWTLDRVVKALYFGKRKEPLIGVVIPELEIDIDTKTLFTERKLLSSRTKAEKYWPNPSYIPKGMAWGTCTPFPLASSVGREISNIIIFDHPPINNKLVNISVGGTKREMFKVSMHLPYEAIYEILRRKFGDKVHLYQS